MIQTGLPKHADPSGAAPAGRAMRLTCLDDDPRMERTLRRFAGRFGHEVRYHGTSAAFKADVLAVPPDLVVLDLELGRETGVDVVQWLAEQTIRPPLVLLSGHGDELLDTARRIAGASGLEVRGAVNKAAMVRDLPPLLGAPAHPALPVPPRAAATRLPLDGAHLARLIRDSRLEPFFQPIIAAADGALRGVEALARLRLADGSLLGAGEIIPVAESAGLILPLTDAMFARLLASREALAGLGLHHLAVNLSVAQLDVARSTDLVRRLVDGLAGCCRVRVELTESAGLADSQAVRELGAQLRLLGASLAMDDFGTGYSSIRALAELPYDTLKIDLSFVAELFDSHKSERLLGAILAMCHSLGVQVVAEGVETEAQRQWLCDAGVDELQGYLFGPPMPLAELLRHYGRSH
jgi:EAL domain-containing protein (putative c-di-GMP-specific phosphodiesterase class I)